MVRPKENVMELSLLIAMAMALASIIVPISTIAMLKVNPSNGKTT